MCKGLDDITEVMNVNSNTLPIANLFPDQSKAIEAWLADHGASKQEQEQLSCLEDIWPIHRILFECIRPRIIVALGITARRSAFWLLSRRLRKDIPWKHISKHPCHQTKWIDVPGSDIGINSAENARIIGIPHPSWPNNKVDIDGLRHVIKSLNIQ